MDWQSIILAGRSYDTGSFCDSTGAYFTYLLVMFLLSLSMSGLFRALGSLSATTTHAQAYGSIGILILILTSGFAIIKRELMQLQSQLSVSGYLLPMKTGSTCSLHTWSVDGHSISR